MMSQRLWWVILWLVGASIALAQVATLAQETASAARPLTLREGEKIVSAACMQGSSVLIAPPPGTFGTMPRNLFRTPGFADWDFSIFKNMKFKERLTAQFRAEFFNIINHPIYAGTDANPSHTSTFGCACTTPDQNSTNPVLGTGGARAIQLGLKLLF